MRKRTELRNYQNYNYEYILNHKACGLFLDMGMGKTVVTLTAFEELAYADLSISNALVVSTKRVAQSVWAQECAEWEHLQHLKVSVLAGLPEKKRLQALDAKADIYTINRENMAWLCAQYGGQKLPFDMLILDESSSFKNHQSQRFKALRKCMSSFKRVVILTGTPIPKGYEDLWAQIYLLDQGERLERFITRYRSLYFRAERIGMTEFSRYLPTKDGKVAIDNKIADLCVSMKSKDYIELPEVVTQTVEVELTAAARKGYEDFEASKILEILDTETEIDAINAAALTSKLLQYSNGAVYDEDRDVHEVHDKKLEALAELVEEANGKPVLVAYNYQHDIPRIQRHLKGKNVKVLKTDKDIQDWNEGKIEVMLAHPASAGHGLNLQRGGNILVWFGLNWSLEYYQQMNKRLHRSGQEHTVFIYHLVCPKTVEDEVVKSLTRKDADQEALLNAIKARIDNFKKMNLRSC